MCCEKKKILLSPLSAAPLRTVVISPDIQKSLNYFEAPFWCAFRNSTTNKLLPLVLLISFPKLLEVWMAVMNQFPQPISIHKSKLGREEFSLFLGTAFPCLSNVFQEIPVIIWIIKAKLVTMWGCRHLPPVLIRSHNTESKLVKECRFVFVFFLFNFLSSSFW